MANTNISLLYPEFWAENFDQLNMGEYNLHNQVASDLSGQLATRGDVVNVPLTPDFGDAVDYTPGSNSAGDEAITQETIPVTLDFSKKISFVLTAKELSLSAYDLIARYAVPAQKALIRSLNQYIYDKLLLSNYLIDARSTFDEDKIVDAKTLLDKNEAPAMGRFLVAGPDDYGAMVKLAKFSDADISGDAETLQSGRIPRRYGFELGMNNIIAEYAPADVAGAINFGAGYTGADFTIVVGSFNDDAKPIKVGDIFTVADETDSPIHTVQSTTTSSGDTIGITFLTKHDQTNGSKADTKVVTVDPTRSILAFTRSAVALATRPYATLPDGSGARMAVINVMGVPVRVSLYQKDLDLRVQYDLLAGAAMVDRKRCVRILR